MDLLNSAEALVRATFAYSLLEIMYACMYACMYVLYVCMYVYMYVCTVCMYALYVCTVCMYALYVCMYVLYVCMYVCICMKYRNRLDIPRKFSVSIVQLIIVCCIS